MSTGAMAKPRSPEELAKLPHRPEVVAAALDRDVADVVHFTTTKGALGVLASSALKSRKRLPETKYLEHVYRPNADFRKDAAWLDYVNLSVSRINDWMFGSSVRWHSDEDVSWVVLAFDPEILGHPGVVFATTNNIYPSCRRAEGLAGFNSLFADTVVGKYGGVHDRGGKSDCWPTDRQAEVLYPGELSCRHLLRIDVQLAETTDALAGILDGLHLEVPVRRAPEVFQ